MSLNHVLTQSNFAEADGLGGRREDITVNNLSMESLTINGYVDVAGSVGIGASHNNSYQLLVQESTADAACTKLIGNSASTVNFLTPSVLQLQNSNSTVGNYESMAFKNSADAVVGFVSCRNIAQANNGNGSMFLGTVNSGTATALLTLTNDLKVGIGNATPANALGLDIGAACTVGTTLEVKGATTCGTTLGVSGATTLNGLNVNTGDTTCTAGNFIASTAGKGLVIKGGSGGRLGLVQLTAGSATVSGITLSANSRIFCFNNAEGGTPGRLSVAINVAGSSFAINSESAGDTSFVAYLVLEQS